MIKATQDFQSVPDVLSDLTSLFLRGVKSSGRMLRHLLHVTAANCTLEMMADTEIRAVQRCITSSLTRRFWGALCHRENYSVTKQQSR